MHTPAPDPSATGSTSVSNAAKGVAEHGSALARLELELAGLEIKRKIAALGIGAVFAVGMLFVGLYAIGFLFATIVAGLATFLPTWLALLIMTVFLFLLVAILGLLAMRAFKRGGAPLPTQAIHEAKETTEALKN